MMFVTTGYTFIFLIYPLKPAVMLMLTYRIESERTWGALTTTIVMIVMYYIDRLVSGSSVLGYITCTSVLFFSHPMSHTVM